MNYNQSNNDLESMVTHFCAQQSTEVAARVAPTSLSILITGESGVSKEVFSQIIHNLSTRKHENFIAVNCGAIPEGTIDSELFGHEKGHSPAHTTNAKVF